MATCVKRIPLVYSPREGCSGYAILITEWKSKKPHNPDVFMLTFGDIHLKC